MCAHAHRRRMIRQDEHSVIRPGIFQRICHGTDDLFINIFDGSYLVIRASLMSHLIRSFYMYINEIKSVFREGLYSRFCLAAIVCVQAAIGAFHADIVNS